MAKEPLNKRIQKFYDRSTPLWERVWGEHLHHGFYGFDGQGKPSHYQAQVDLVYELLKWGGVEEAKNILDVGCGVGGSACYLAEHFQARVTGITLSSVQVESAQQRAAKRRLGDSTEFLLADAMQPPFKDNSFDLIWSLEACEHFPDKAKFFRECYRMLRPGGSLLMATWCHRPEPPELSMREAQELQKIYRAYHLPPMVSLDHLRDFAGKSGFTKIRVADWTRAVTPFWPAVVRSALKPVNWVGILRAGIQTIRGALAMRLMIRGYRTGLLRFGVLWSCKT